MALQWHTINIAFPPWPKILTALTWPKKIMALPQLKILMALPSITLNQIGETNRKFLKPRQQK